MLPATHPPLLTRDNTERPSDFTLAGIPEVPFYGREFDVKMRTCQNPVCTCGTITLFLYIPERLETNDYSFRILGDALERRFNTDESAENSGRAARILDLYLTPADWVSIEQEWRLIKAMLIEVLDPKHLNFSVEFHDDFRREPSKLISFNSVFSLHYPYRATFREKEFQLLDWYCANSSCQYTRAMFSFERPGKEFFSFGYDHRNSDIEISAESKDKITDTEARQLMEQLKSRFPDFDQSIKNRNQVLRALQKADLKNHPTPKPVSARTFPNIPLMLTAADIGRNDPCPCGSGKKYKRCCGK